MQSISYPERNTIGLSAGLPALQSAAAGSKGYPFTKNKNADEIVTVMIQKMAEKYAEDFKLITLCDGQAGNPYTMIMVSCKKHPGGEIMARACRDEKGEWIVQDNYISYYMLHSVRERVAAIAENVYGNCKVFNKPASMVLPEFYSLDMSPEDFLSRKESLVNIYIYLPPNAAIGEKEEKAAFLKKELCSQRYRLKGLICYTGQDDFYQQVTEYFYREAYTEKKQITATGIFLLENEEEYSYLRWS